MTDTDLCEELQADLESSPYNAFCGFRIEEADRDSGRLTMLLPSRIEHQRLAGNDQLHGGPIAAFIDTAGCYACIMLLGHGVPTINFRVDYLRPAAGTLLRAIATVRKAGRSIATVDIDVVDENARLVAMGRATYSASAG